MKRAMVVLAIMGMVLATVACMDIAEEEKPLETGMLDEPLPDGFTYLGKHEINASDVGVVNVSADEVVEGVYRYNNTSDVYLVVATTENASGFYDEYVGQYKEWFVMGSRFSTESVNGHDVLVVKKQHMEAGEQVYDYDLVWQNSSQVVIVKAPSVSTGLKLAGATGL